MKFKTCESCKCDVPKRARFCPRCGTRCKNRTWNGAWGFGGAAGLVICVGFVAVYHVRVETPRIAAVSMQAARDVPNDPVPIAPPPSSAKPDSLEGPAPRTDIPDDLVVESAPGYRPPAPGIPDDLVIDSVPGHPASLSDLKGVATTRPLMPAVNPADSTQTVSSVVYLCDGSGSMLGEPFDLLKAEVGTAIDSLEPQQSFNVLFFQKGGTTALSQTLLGANQKNKTDSHLFLQRVGLGSSSDAVPSLRLAFLQRPQLIYLLTDGDFETGSSTVTNEQVIEEIRRLNAEKKTRISTIAFFPPGAPQSERKVCEGLLRMIAAENGGTFNIVFVSAR